MTTERNHVGTSGNQTLPLAKKVKAPIIWRTLRLLNQKESSSFSILRASFGVEWRIAQQEGSSGEELACLLLKDVSSFA
jgi:hypothetical protein